MQAICKKIVLRQIDQQNYLLIKPLKDRLPSPADFCLTPPLSSDCIAITSLSFCILFPIPTVYSYNNL